MSRYLVNKDGKPFCDACKEFLVDITGHLKQHGIYEPSRYDADGFDRGASSIDDPIMRELYRQWDRLERTPEGVVYLEHITKNGNANDPYICNCDVCLKYVNMISDLSKRKSDRQDWIDAQENKSLPHQSKDSLRRP